MLFIRYLGGDRCKRGECFFPRRRQFYTCNGWIGIYSICASDISLKKEVLELEYDQKFVRIKIFPREEKLIHRKSCISYRLVLSIRGILQRRMRNYCS